jgi:hypothetical protein
MEETLGGGEKVPPGRVRRREVWTMGADPVMVVLLGWIELTRPCSFDWVGLNWIGWSE